MSISGRNDETTYPFCGGWSCNSASVCASSPATFNSISRNARSANCRRTSSSVGNGRVSEAVFAISIPPTVASWQITACPSADRRTSNSNPSHPCCKQSSNDAKEFSGIWRTARAPRCPKRRGFMEDLGSRFSAAGKILQGLRLRTENRELRTIFSVQIKIPDRPSRVRRFFGLFHRLLEFFLQQLRGMLLRFHRLPEDRIPTAILLLHGASRFFHVVECFWLDRRGVRDDAACRSVDFHDRAAAGASHVKIRFTKIGFALHHTEIISQSGSARCQANRQNAEHIQQLPTQQDDRHQHHQYGQNLTKVQACLSLLKASRPKAQNIQRGKAKHQRPENVVNPLAGRSQKEHRRQSRRQNDDRHRVQPTAREPCPAAGLLHSKNKQCVTSRGSRGGPRQSHAEI